MSKVLVAIDAPHVILAVGSNIGRVLGYSPHQLKGCILQTLQGPETDTVLLRSVIKSACENDTAACCQIVLYDSKGRRKNIIITCSKYIDAARVGVGCMLTLKNSPALSLADINICMGDHASWVMASAVWPFSIYFMSDELSRLFGYKATDIDGLTLLSLTAPACHPTCWDPVIQSAGTGSITTGAACLRHFSGVELWLTFTCSPVVEWPNSIIAHVLLVFDHMSRPTTVDLDRSDMPAGALKPAGAQENDGQPSAA